MASALLIGGIALAAGVGYLVWKKSQEAKKPPAPSTCDSACTLAGDPGGHAVCVAACDVAGSLLDHIPDPFNNSIDDLTAAEKGADTGNRKLNGDVDIALPQYGAPIGAPPPVSGTVARFKNGCVPLAGAPGFEKCKLGTKSMWTHEILSAQGFDPDVYATERRPYGASYSATRIEIKPEQTFSGEQGDVFTYGPWTTPAADGSQEWVDRGQHVKCPKDQAPSDVIAGIKGQRGYGPQCVSSVGGGQAGIAVTTCAEGRAAGFIWDQSLAGGAGAWRRPRAGNAADALSTACPPDAPAPDTYVASAYHPLRSLIT